MNPLPTPAEIDNADILMRIVCNAAGVIFLSGVVISALMGGFHV